MVRLKVVFKIYYAFYKLYSGLL